MNNTMTDTIDALVDAIHIRAGVLDEQAAHPRAPALANRERERLLPALAKLYADRLNVRRGGTGSVSLVTSDLANTLSGLLRVATVRSLQAHAGHRQFCKELPVPNFLEHQFPNFDLNFQMDEVPEGGEARSTFNLVDQGGVNARLKTYATEVTISRHIIVNDDIELIAQVGTSAGATASRREAALVYATLESNPLLGDGVAMFHAGHGNLIGGVLDSTSFAAALGALRSQLTASGEPADLPARYLVVSPGLELTARALRRSGSLDTELAVISSPWLAAGHWYLSTDPELSTTLAITHLENSQGVSVGSTLPPIEVDGFMLQVTADFGVVPVGRVGIVRGHA